MAIILHIDTSLPEAQAILSDNGSVLASAVNLQLNEHGAWLHTAIEKLFSKTGIHWQQVSAVSVAEGPGSYTGLRIGVAAAKGFCFARQLPLITVSNLKLFVEASRGINAQYYIPMIDARRMEVFTAVYDSNGQILTPPFAHILEDGSFLELLNKGAVLFCGDGAKKWSTACSHSNARFFHEHYKDIHHVKLACEAWEEKRFADLAYQTPVYVKDFQVKQSVKG
jgi:tRNA threonylcarbamoyladenosine biosynthesis protein TsaB